MPERAAKAVVDAGTASLLLGRGDNPEITPGFAAEFFNPFNRIIDIATPDFSYGLGPGRHVCCDPVAAEKLKSIAANYGIVVL